MMRKSTLYFMFLFFFFISCGKKSAIKESEIIKSVETGIIKIVDIHANTHIDISSLLDTIKYVKLELTEESIIGYIQKITIYEDRIYILDTQTSSLFVFDINGNYLFKIDRRGAGPEEYIQLDFFDIDFRNNEIMLTDLMGYWVMKYDMDGNFINFISREKIPFWIEGYDSWLITELSIDDLLSWREKIDHTLFKNPFLRNKKILADELTIDDNPVLMFYKLKSF